MALHADFSEISEPTPRVVWFYRRNGVSHGPVSLADLRAAAVLGFLAPEDLARPQEFGAWRPVGEISAIADLFDPPKKGTGR